MVLLKISMPLEDHQWVSIAIEFLHSELVAVPNQMLSQRKLKINMYMIENSLSLMLPKFKKKSLNYEWFIVFLQLLYNIKIM